VQATDGSSAAVAAELLAFFHHLMRDSGPATFRLLDELDLSFTQMKTLHLLRDCQDGEPSVKDLSERCGMSLAATSRTVDSLLRRELVTRREDDRDRRVKRLRITAAGAEMVQRIDSTRLEGLQEFTRTLSDDQRRRLADALADLPYDR